MRPIMSICNAFADDLSIILNVKKSKCLIIQLTHRADSFITPKPVFTLEVMLLMTLTNVIILVTLLTIVPSDGADI